MSHKRSHILSVGTAVPDRILANKDFESFLDTTDEWITTRTGIRRRHVYEPGKAEPAFELGARAASRALANARLSPSDIDGIICATFTPDYLFPSTACCIARSLGIKGACAFDLSAACAGFVYGLSVAQSLILSGQCRRIILVGVEIISRTLDWSDRSTAILFGDGAGAVVIGESDDGGRGILSTCCMSDAALGDILTLPLWGEKRFMRMKGSEVFKHAVRMMGNVVVKALAHSGLSCGDVDVFIPHQANMRIIISLAAHLGIPLEKVVTNLDEYGNTSSASIPLALEDAWKSGRIRDGSVVAFTALGGGVAYGSAVVRF